MSTPHGPVRAEQGLRASNAAGPHGDRRSKRRRNRGARERAALRDQDKDG